MDKCPFLSTSIEEVQCFKTCSFYSKDEPCPFKICEEKDMPIMEKYEGNDDYNYSYKKDERMEF